MRLLGKSIEGLPFLRLRAAQAPAFPALARSASACLYSNLPEEFAPFLIRATILKNGWKSWLKHQESVVLVRIPFLIWRSSSMKSPRLRRELRS